MQQRETFLSKFQVGASKDLAAFLDHCKAKTRGISTGLPGFDAQMRGLQGIVGILGGPKACKSTLALQVALFNAQRGNPVAIIDRENGLSHMHERMISHIHGVSWKDFTERSEAIQTRAWQELSELPLGLYTGAFSMQELESWLDGEISKLSKDSHALLVLDSLHKLPMELDQMRMSVDKWLLFLDYLKLKYNRKLVIITTCEKRRGAYDEATKDGGKESGRIEYTLEQQLDMRIGDDGGIILECTYNRHGPCGDRIFLEPLYVNKADKWSFTFKLREQRSLGI